MYRRKDNNAGGGNKVKKENDTGNVAVEESKRGRVTLNAADTRMSNVEEPSSKKDDAAQRHVQRRRNQRNDVGEGTRRRDMAPIDAAARKKNRGPSKVLQHCDELTMLSYNVRGLNTEAKQQRVYEMLRRHKPHLVCLNETKLQSALYLDHYWSFQTTAQRSGGVWTASLTNAKLSMVKTIGTYLCWTQLEIGAH